MEDKELNEFRSNKPHNDKELLAKLWNSDMKVRDIAKHLHISTKLVHLKLREHGLF